MTAHTATKQVLESAGLTARLTTKQVTQVETHSPARTRTTTTPAAHVSHLVGMLPVFTELVVVLATCRITNNLVRLIDLLELLLSAIVVRIHIGMKLPRHPSVSRFNVFLGGTFIDSE